MKVDTKRLLENKFRILKIALNALLMILLMYKSLLTEPHQQQCVRQRQYSLSLGESLKKVGVLLLRSPRLFVTSPFVLAAHSISCSFFTFVSVCGGGVYLIALHGYRVSFGLLPSSSSHSEKTL
jgi:hypothetical protein